MQQLSLDIFGWSVKAVGDLSAVPAALRGISIPARVPGCIHTDLLRAQLINDPLVGTNEREVQWIGETDWEYRASFDANADLLKHERIDLVCEGLDTIAEISVNGTEVGRAANMFHPHRFNLRSEVRSGPNDLTITFRSPLKHIRAEEARLGKRPVNGDWDPYIFIRKAACNFGWDWAPRVATCGIWKSIGIEAWNTVRIASLRPLAWREVGSNWRVSAHIDLELASPQTDAGLIEATAWISTTPKSRLNEVWREPVPHLVGEHWQHAPSDSNAGFIIIEVVASQPTLWQVRPPRPQGSYSINVAVHDAGEVPRQALATAHRPLGFRQVKLKTQRDEHGSVFTFELNGRDVFCKGANWIPEGPWPADLTRDKYRERLQQAAGANMNMLRVWGGGYYESDAFYELCDELGIMVWQDFMFACAMYPEEAPYPKLIEEEARHQITRLSSHPSVVLWCGGNECTWAHDAWGNAPGEKLWKDRLEGKTWGSAYYHDLFPRLLKEFDPTRPYWPNSPWPGSKDLPPNSANHGDRHTWDLRGDAYRNLVPRFCSEFGHQSPSNYATLATVLSADEHKLGSPALDHHQRATGGTARHIDEPIAELFRPPQNFNEWHYLAQLTQARAIRTGIEWLRVNRPSCMGALIWQLNECWPGMNWSLIDSGGREKPAYHAAQAAFRNRLVTIQPFNGKPWLCVVNDTDQPARYLLDVRRLSFDGEVLATGQVDARCPPSNAARVMNLESLLGPPRDPTREFIVTDIFLRRAMWFYLPDRDLRYLPAKFELREGGDPSAASFTLTAKTLIRDMALIPDRLRGISGFGNMTLIPGQTLEFDIPDWIDPRTADRSPPRFRCANEFGGA